jgi:hypothetical protein
MGKKRDQGKRTDLSISFELNGNNDGTLKLKQEGDHFYLIDAEGKILTEVNAERIVSHERDNAKKGPKVRTKNGASVGAVSIGGLAELAKLDYFFAIDTNTKPFNGVKVSVACFFALKLKRENEGYRLMQAGPAQLLEIYDCNDNPELAAILEIAIQELESKQQYNADHKFRVGIITDTELGLHKAINSRSAPVYKNQFLPEGFSLIYASSDTGNELPNTLIKACDKAATDHINRRSKHGFPPSELRLKSDSQISCSYFRTDLAIGDTQIPFLTINEDTRATITFEGDDGRIETHEVDLS